MKRIIQIIIAVIIALVLLILGYFYLPEIWGEAIYPLKFRQEIINASEEYSLERNFIAAVIYTESHFNPEARSRVGATGLMQLMPATAAGVANNIGMNDYSPSRLTEPSVNIRLGSAYLKSQYDKYNGNYDAILAHYNGGPRAAGLLLDNNRVLMPLETQGFIRKVKNTWGAYDSIYGKEWGGPVKPFSVNEEKTFVEQLNMGTILDFLLGR